MEPLASLRASAKRGGAFARRLPNAALNLRVQRTLRITSAPVPA